MHVLAAHTGPTPRKRDSKKVRIKCLIKSLGGVTKAVRIMWGASFSWEKIRALGGAAAALGAELLGIAAVKRGCFR